MIVDDASVVAVWLDDPDALVDPWAGVPWVRLTLTVAAFAAVGAALGLAERAASLPHRTGGVLMTDMRRDDESIDVRETWRTVRIRELEAEVERLRSYALGLENRMERLETHYEQHAVDDYGAWLREAAEVGRLKARLEAATPHDHSEATESNPSGRCRRCGYGRVR